MIDSLQDLVKVISNSIHNTIIVALRTIALTALKIGISYFVSQCIWPINGRIAVVISCVRILRN